MSDDAPPPKITAKPGRIEMEHAGRREAHFVDQIVRIREWFDGERPYSSIQTSVVEEGGDDVQFSLAELLAAIDEAKRMERAETPWESVGLDPLWRLERISLRAQLSLAEKKLQDRDDLEALIASVVTPNTRRAVEFSMAPDGSYVATIRDYSQTLMRLVNYSLRTQNGPTFAAALRAAIEKLGEGKEGK